MTEEELKAIEARAREVYSHVERVENWLADEVFEGDIPALIVEVRRLQSRVPGVGAALDVALRYGGISGDHHRAWVIDQMVRALTGNDYARWVAEFEAGKDGPKTYAWNVGIPP